MILRSAWDISRACRPTWRVAHLALDLGPRHQSRHRVDDDDVQRAGADQHVHDLERLLTGVRLGDQQAQSVSTPSFFAYSGSRACSASMKAAMPPVALRVRHGVQSVSVVLPGGLRAVDLHHAAARESPDAEGDVESQWSRWE